ncbi:MAG: sterol desaturase family protein [Spirochaetota bacterium]
MDFVDSSFWPYILLGEFFLLWLLELRFAYYTFPESKLIHAVKNLSFTSIGLAIRYPLVIFLVDFYQRSSLSFALLRLDFLAPSIKLICSILLLDIWMYFWHRCNHTIPFLWNFHRVHHSDPSMDVTSSARFHFGELLLSESLRVPFFLLMGFSAKEIAFYNFLMMANVILHHSNLALPMKLDRFWRLFFASPFMHKIHHSQIPADTNSNYGSLFSFWDRIFASYRMRETKDLLMGLDTGESTQEKQTLLQLLLTPIVKFNRL